MTHVRLQRVHSMSLCRLVMTAVLFMTVVLSRLPSAVAQRLPTPGMDSDELDSDWMFGFDMFQLMLEQRGLKTTDDLVGTLQNDPSKSAIVLAGNLDGLPDWMWPQMTTFIRRGGAVLVATDREMDADGLCFMAQGPVQVTTFQSAYKGYSDCPLVTNIEGTEPLMRGVSTLVANRSGWVDRIGRQQGQWTMLAWLPHSARTRNGTGGGKPLAAAMMLSDGNPGRLLAVGDHSLFINGMLWHGDNAMFALNATGWLAAGGRKNVVVLVNGIPALPGAEPSANPSDMPNINPEDLPDLPKESYLAFANNFAAGLEDADVFNELAINYPDEVASGQYWQAVFLALACLAGWLLFRRFPNKGQAVDAPLRRSVTSLLATRVQEQLQSENLRPAARELARDLFRDLTRSDDPRSWSIDARDVTVDGSLILKRHTRASLTRFCQLARNADRKPVTRKELRSLVGRIEQIRTLHEEGRLLHPWFIPAEVDGQLSSASRDSKRSL
jgi:hypothetical protein